MLTRRTFLADLAVALASSAACSTPGRPRTDEQETPAAADSGRPAAPTGPKLRVAHVPGALCHVGLRVAQQRGFFAAEGLDVDLLPADISSDHADKHTAAWVVDAAQSKPADITVIEYPALVDIILGKLDYYVVAGEHSGCRQLVVPIESPIKNIADLKGKRIAQPPFNDRLIWDYLVRQAGVDPETVQWVIVSVPQGGAEEEAFVQREFAAGRLDAYVAGDPSGEIFVNKKIARRLASNTWTSPLSGWYCCMIAVRRELIDAHPEIARAVTRACRRSAEFIQRSPAEAVRLSVDGGYLPRDTPQDVCARLLGDYVWTATGRIEEDLERYFQLLVESGRLTATSSPAELVKRVYRSGD